MAASSASTSATAPASPASDRADDARRADRDEPAARRLRGVKLQALVRDHLGRDDRRRRRRRSRPGAALVADGAAWVLVEDEPERGLGPALAWALRNGADVARTSSPSGRPGCWPAGPAGFAFPIDGLARRRAHAAAGRRRAARSPRRRAAAGAPRARRHDRRRRRRARSSSTASSPARCAASRCAASSTTRTPAPCASRSASAPTTARRSRSSTATCRPSRRSPASSRAVAEHRRPGRAAAPAQPAGARAPAALAARAGPGAARAWRRVAPAQPPVPRPNVKDRVPCSAIGRRADGSPVRRRLLGRRRPRPVPYALDARAAAGATPGVERGEVWLVAPPRDLVPVTAELAALADQPLSLVPFSG